MHELRRRSLTNIPRKKQNQGKKRKQKKKTIAPIRTPFCTCFLQKSSTLFLFSLFKVTSGEVTGGRRGGDSPEPLLSRAPLEREGCSGGSLDADLVVRRGVQRVFLLGCVVVGREESVSGTLALGNAALCTTRRRRR